MQNLKKNMKKKEKYNMAIKYICQQCGKDLKSSDVQECPHCKNWTVGLTKKEYNQLQKTLNKLIK